MRINRICRKINCVVAQMDRWPLWVLFPILLAAVMAPVIALGEGSVFGYHDQLDEVMMSMVFSAKHMGDGLKIWPEMMGGLDACGLQPAAALFVPLYRFLPVFWAFVTQYAVIFTAGFLGMYLCVKELTESSFLSLIAAGCFCMLPHLPVYGLSEVGIPLAVFAFLQIWKEKNVLLSYGILVFFGLTSSLVLTGYVVLGFWAVGTAVSFLRRRKWGMLAGGFALLTAVYVWVNRNLFWELFLGMEAYVSHREEMVTYAMPFWKTVWEAFTSSTQYVPSLHRYLILPIMVSLILGIVCYKKMERKSRKRLFLAWAGLFLLFGIALFYGFCRWRPVVDFKNGLHGFLHYFQMERFCWIYPAGWYLETALCCSIWWGMKGKGKISSVLLSPTVQLCVIAAVMMPTLKFIKENSYLYMNVNQYNNGSGITGYISWESYYAEDLMQQLEDAIGRDMSTYRVAHLGICPAPALMHGFYTVDGYSNNYPLEYKHRFRKVIAKELEKNRETQLYFDEWGSRCYLFNGTTGSAWMLGKDSEIVYEKLELDMEALQELGCEYLFSCGEIKNARELGLSLMGCYETDIGYWRVWLYGLQRTANGGSR